MGSALRILITFALMMAVGLSACGRRGSLDRPTPSGPETAANPSTKMSQAPDRRLPVLDRLIE
jgi:predicted small lipoprotein YifL